MVTDDSEVHWPTRPIQQPKLIRTQSAPLLDSLSKSSSGLESNPVHRPDVYWHRSSYDSNESSQESAIQDDDDEEEEEEEEDPAGHPVNVSLLIVPTFVFIKAPPSIRHIHRAPATNLLSASLPASMSRAPIQECVTQELLQLTQPLRDGLLSPQRMLPAARIKQVGVGGRGKKRHLFASGTVTKPLSLPGLPHLPIVQSTGPIPLVAPRPIRAWQRDQA
ncbi:hypothetical protein CROQUDRAFT_136982 [Cronartium quercuum f. sp. fusiforme G11]|uniref:Uncharacterized protein n=1 Tax=Cronartium quercuum f. sp. fusiforme G11 TaxID=708437 RepID=A0A9P6T5G2_9BASI|nr:hypothetical protein CROQUDRAFT_136982 [Cronartium quercuum f. sp. fusiforme G11]